MDRKQELKGELIIFSEVVIWAFFPVMTVISYVSFPSLVSLFWSTIFSGMFFIAVTAYKRNWVELRNPLLWKYSALATLFIGIIFYGLYFWGLSKTSPGNAGIIALFEVFTSFLFFNVWNGEHISEDRKFGAALIVFGACVVLLPNVGAINAGDFLILLATFFAPAGNYFTQKARKIATAENILFLRALIAAPFLFLLIKILDLPIGLGENTPSLLFIVVNGFIIFGLSKILWVEGINYLSVTKAIALSSTGPLITLFLSWIILGQVPNFWQISAVLPMMLGVLMLTDQLRPFARQSRN